MARAPIAPHPDAAQDLATALPPDDPTGLPPDGIAPEMPALLAPDPEAEAREAALDRILFADAPEGCATYLLIDAAADPLIATTLEAFPEPARCLFDGQALEDLAEVGPWLVQLHRHGRAWAWFIEEGWGRNWGVLIHSPLPLPKLKTRLKAPLRVTGEDGGAHFFKYYRPRHLAAYLPAMRPAQAATMMRGITAYLVETPGDPSTLLRITQGDDGAVVQDRMSLA
jgi:hypothetical protein